MDRRPGSRWRAARYLIPWLFIGGVLFVILQATARDPSGRAESAAGEAERVSGVAIWSRADRKSTAQSFQGGDFTIWMGGGDLDLRGAGTAPAGATIEVLVVMGGLEIRVPEEWHVVDETVAVLGKVEDRRRSTSPAGRNVLKLAGLVVMGRAESRS
jgi:hypothetical protein